MTTDITLDLWKRWLARSIAKNPDSILSDLPIQLRDSEDVKSYPGIFVSEGSSDRVEVGGVMDGNVWQIEIHTQLVTTPGEDDQAASSKTAHDALRNALSAHVNDPASQGYLNSQIRFTCFDVRSSSPTTGNEEGYRVTTWKNTAVVCYE